MVAADSGSAPPLRMCVLPELHTLETLLSTAYQATLLREEERAVTFRLIVGDRGSFPDESGPPEGLHRLAFSHPRPFTEHELRRLSPAAKYHRSLIGIERANGGDLAIWGLLQSGPRWLDNVRGGRRFLPTLPSTRLVVRATGPGRIAVASGATTLGEIRGGKITAPAMDAFESQWLPEMFRGEREALVAEHDAARQNAADEWGDLDPDVARMLPQQMVKRVISTVRSAHHGGTLVILPHGRADEITSSLVRLKYAFDPGEPRRRFRTLMLAVMRRLAESAAPGSSMAVGWSVYGSSHDPALAELNEAVFELSHLFAALADVDGAVVMTKRFEVIGFGGEIAGDLPDVRTVLRAVDLEGTEREEEAVEGVGTRHRSAYRLCSRVHDALAVVVSHDGTVRFVKWHDGAVTYWDHVSAGSPEG